MTQRARLHPSDIGAASSLILEIQNLEGLAHQYKLVATAKALNDAKNAAGWELAEQMERLNAVAAHGEELDKK